MKRNVFFVSALLGCGSAISAAAAPALSPSDKKPLDWDQTFKLQVDRRPLHFVAGYVDRRGHHRLEEWRAGDQHLRRLTDARIDLHADRAAAADYTWQIIDREKKVVHRMGSSAMQRAGMFYSYYSMAHVLSRPAGRFALTAELRAENTIAGTKCRWYRLSPEGQPASEICWAAAPAIPLSMEAQAKDGTWVNVFRIESLDHKPISPELFTVDAKDLQVRNMDDIQADD